MLFGGEFHGFNKDGTFQELNFLFEHHNNYYESRFSHFQCFDDDVDVVKF